MSFDKVLCSWVLTAEIEALLQNIEFCVVLHGLNSFIIAIVNYEPTLQSSFF